MTKGTILKTSRQVISFISLIFFSFHSVSCNQDCPIQKVQKLMGKNFKRKIVFSEKLKKTNDGKALQDYSDDLTKPSAKFRIVHFFDADCSTCVEDLKKIQEKIVKSKSTERLKYVFIGSSISEGNFENILTESDLQIPVYFQKGNLEFKRQNQLPLTDNVYNTILINDENQMLLFGSYFDSELAHDLATKLMNCL